MISPIKFLPRRVYDENKSLARFFVIVVSGIRESCSQIFIRYFDASVHVVCMHKASCAELTPKITAKHSIPVKCQLRLGRKP